MLEKLVRDRNEPLQYLPRKEYGTVLDLGCGKGRFSHVLSEFSSEVYAADIDSNQLSSFNWFKQNIHRIQSAGQSLPFPDATFDLVVCFTVIEHVPPEDNGQFLNEIYRVMKEDATLYIINDAKFYRFLRKYRLLYPDRGPDPNHVNMITPRELERRLRNRNFSIRESHYTPFSNWSLRLDSKLLSPFALKGHVLCKK